MVRFDEHCRSIISRDNTTPVARHFTPGNHCGSDIRIQALCPILDNNDSCKRQEMHLFHSQGTLHLSFLNERLIFETKIRFSGTLSCLHATTDN